MFERGLLLSLLLLPGLALGQGLTDPTRPPAGAGPSATQAAERAVLRVSSILASSERRLARVNGSWVREGDRVAGARVLRIGNDAVRFSRDRRVFEIRLDNGRVDKQWQTPAAADEQRTTQ